MNTRTLAIVITILAGTSTASANTAITAAPSPPAAGGFGSGHAIGFTFEISAPITITELGAWSSGTGRVPVGIYDRAGTLLTWVQVDHGDRELPVRQGYRYAPITPLELMTGEYSVIGAFEVGVNYFGWSDTGTSTYSPEIAFNRMQVGTSGVWNSLPGFLPENSDGWSDQYRAVNFEFLPGVAPTLFVAGECPGTAPLSRLDFTVVGTPRHRVALVSGLLEGDDRVEVARCSDIETGLWDPVVHGGGIGIARIGNCGEDLCEGSFSWETPGPAYCGRPVQVLDMNNCLLSDVTAIPGERAPLVCPEGTDGVSPGWCPSECTGGCDGSTCIIDCTGTSTCQTYDLICPDGMDCEVRCWGQSSCQVAEFFCPPTQGNCTIQCDAASSCQLIDVYGGNGRLDIRFTNLGGGSGHVYCGLGPCHTSCADFSALSTLECGASCDCSSTAGAVDCL